MRGKGKHILPGIQVGCRINASAWAAPFPPSEAAAAGRKGVTYADAFILRWGMSCNRKRMELWNRGNDGRLK